MQGVNVSGAEFAADKLPGVANKDYVYPSADDIAQFAGLGMNTIRVPFLWERLQPALNGPLDPEELTRIDAVIALASARNVTVILDPHNYGRYRGAPVGSDAVPTASFLDFWRRLAQHSRNSRNVAFGLMNEPVEQGAEGWAKIAQAAVQAIRQTGATQLVLVPGTNWTGAHSWAAKIGQMSNAEALAGLRDPANNMAVEVHQYFDADSSGTKPSCVSAAAGRDALTGFTQWLRQTRHRGFLGEFGASTDPVCLAALDGTLGYIAQNGDVWQGWTYWAAGDWFGDYMFNILPPSDRARHPQVDVLARYLGQPAR